MEENITQENSKMNTGPQKDLEMRPCDTQTNLCLKDGRAMGDAPMCSTASGTRCPQDSAASAHGRECAHRAVRAADAVLFQQDQVRP